jgi:hypothetical protein
MSSLAAFAVVVSLVTTAADATAPSATVRPNQRLTNGQSVKVAWRNFESPKDKYIAITQCTRASNDGNAAHCDADNAVVVAAAKAGSASFTVETGAIGTLGETCGTSRSDRDNCLIGVVGLNRRLAPVTGQHTSVPIAFTP